MIDILNLSKEIATPSFETVTFDFLISQQEKEVQDAIKYYRANRRSTPAGHWIYRLCKLLDWGSDITFANCYFRAKSEEEALCRNVGIYTSINAGHSIGLNMGMDGECVAFVNNHLTSADYSSIGARWKTQQPIKVVSRPGITGSLNLPDDPTQDYYGYSAISVDVCMLALMYLGFKKEEFKKPLNERMTTSDFVSGYVLPNMMYSQFTCIVHNMFDNEAMYSNVEDIRTPFTNSSRIKDLIDEAETILAANNGKRMSNLEYANSLPKVWDKPFHSVVKVEPLLTVNNYWANVVTGIGVAKAILGNIEQTDGNTTLNLFNRVNRRVRSERTFAKMPEGIGDYFRAEYDFIKLSI